MCLILRCNGVKDKHKQTKITKNNTHTHARREKCVHDGVCKTEVRELFFMLWWIFRILFCVFYGSFFPDFPDFVWTLIFWNFVWENVYILWWIFQRRQFFNRGNCKYKKTLTGLSTKMLKPGWSRKNNNVSLQILSEKSRNENKNEWTV